MLLSQIFIIFLFTIAYFSWEKYSLVLFLVLLLFNREALLLIVVNGVLVELVLPSLGESIELLESN